jgi:predicted nuclease of predicted toxin-antitoxin system
VKVLLDMNLSPAWVAYLSGMGVEAEHWSRVGPPGAPDTQVMAWARDHHQVIFTNDLDFSALLASTRDAGPSVLQIRLQDLMPVAVGELVLGVLRAHEAVLEAGAIVTVAANGARVRVLPLAGDRGE